MAKPVKKTPARKKPAKKIAPRKAAAKRPAARPVTKKVAKKIEKKGRAPSTPVSKTRPAPAPKKPIMMLAEFREDFIATFSAADRDLLVSAREESESEVDFGWWDHGADTLDLAPAYKRYLRKPAALEEIMDGVLTRAWSMLPKEGPDSEYRRFS